MRNLNIETRNTKQILISNIRNGRAYDLEERTLRFAQQAKDFIKGLPQSVTNIEFARQLARSSASIGANDIEANESLGRRDFLMRIRICKKEAKETSYWLRLIDIRPEARWRDEREDLLREAKELMMIFGSISQKLQ